MSDQERLHALDAVRAFALLLGVVLHATVPFYPGMLKGIWAVVDTSPSLVLADLGLWIHMFRMTLFFLIAGYFARLMVDRRGVRGFLTNRRQRILYPLLLGVVLVIPPTGALFVVGISREFGGLTHIPATPQPAGFFPLLHLWFLYYLLLFYGALLLLRAAVHAIDRRGTLRALVDRGVGCSLSTGLAAILPGLPVLLMLLQLPGWSYFAGIPNPENSLIPAGPACAAYGTAILFGWLVQRQPGHLQVIQRRWPLYLGLALAGTAVCGVLLGGASPVIPVPSASRLIWAVAYQIAAWSWMLAITGAALRFLSDYSAPRRYLADASYWIYLAHLPVVVGIAVVIGHWPLHWTVKFPLTVGLALALLLLSYHYLVRPTFAGALLNGRRYAIHTDSARAPTMWYRLPAVTVSATNSPDGSSRSYHSPRSGVARYRSNTAPAASVIVQYCGAP